MKRKELTPIYITNPTEKANPIQTQFKANPNPIFLPPVLSVVEGFYSLGPPVTSKF